MLSLKIALCALTIVTIFTTLPTATQCDSSYYEKYYAARRFLPHKRSTLLPYNFTLQLPHDAPTLAHFERLALTGDVKQLGAWSAARAILLNRTSAHNVWQAAVQLPANASISYRYFIATLHNETDTLLIRRWESQLQARQFNTSALPGNRSDIFGRASSAAEQSALQRGWLNDGQIVQFKLFRNPIQFEQNDSVAPDERIFFKLQPVDPHLLTPILPSARANAEYVRMQYGNSHIAAQPEFGVPYDTDDIVIFHTTLSEPQNVAYLLKVYRAREGSELINLLGYQYIYPAVLQDSEGKFSLKLIAPIWLHVIGSVDIEYLVIKPLPYQLPAVNFRTTFVDYWRANWTQLDIGHRGLGRSFKLAASNAPAITENTVAAMQAAGELGADLVEFDVMLTKDLVPIIHHDYFVYVCMDSKTPKSKDDLTAVLIKDITYEQLKDLKTYQVVGTKIIEYPAHNNVEQAEYRLFPRFEEFLTQVNHSVGFDIEIKWPQRKFNGELESLQTIDKNLYVDCILNVMLRHGCGRLSFFTSFDADICSLLRFKQNMYPVLFLSASKEATYADPRSDTIYDAVNNAQAFDLAGIVPNAVFIQKDPSWIEVAMRQQKQVFVWGDNLKDAESIGWFKSTGPTGVIYDRVDLWLPADKQSAFELEQDLPEFFQLQCEPLKIGEGEHNATAERILSNVNLF